MRPRRALVVMAIGILGLWPSAVAAQGVGVRAGISGDPTQFYVGAHVDAGPVFDHVWFRPNVEAGFGSNAVLVGINLELVWRHPIPKRAWSLLLGGGPAAVFTTYDRPGGSVTETGGGFNLLIGAEHRGGFFSELKVGLLDSPGIKFGVGYAFR